MNSLNLISVAINGSTVICVAPYNDLNIGDKVIIDQGTGEVVDKVYTFTEDDVYKFMKDNMEMKPVISVIRNIDYEGVQL